MLERGRERLPLDRKSDSAGAAPGGATAAAGGAAAARSAGADGAGTGTVPPVPDPVALIDAWLAIEALQPQVFPSQEKLIQDEGPRRTRGKPTRVPPRLLLPFQVESGQMPWQDPAGDRKLLGLAEDEAVRWYLPLAFVKMRPAVELLVRDVEPDGPERERADGVAVLALVPFDEAGFPALSKMALSSFGWACGEVLAGRIGTLHRFVDLQEELCREIGGARIERAPDGSVVPTTRRGFAAAMTALMRRLSLPKDVLERPRVAIRVVGEPDKEPVDIISSFFLCDLHRVRTRLREGGGGPLLAAYLGQDRPAARHDVLADKALLERLVAPGRQPLARWPAPKPAKLVTLQQAAVNAAAHDLAQGGLLSVNGPPGTGKTTLLRDVVAAVIQERADALLAFEDPAKAFSPVEVVAEGGSPPEPARARPDAAWARHRRRVVQQRGRAERQRGVAARQDGGQRTGCPVLPRNRRLRPRGRGKLLGSDRGRARHRSNRTSFVEGAWWHPEWGLERYLKAATGGRVGQPGAPPPKIVDAEAPPLGKGAAMERWRRARLEYREKRSNVARMRDLRERVRGALWGAAPAQQELETARAHHAEALDRAAEAAATKELAAATLHRAEAALEDARRLLEGSTALRPNAAFRLLGLDADWRQQQARALDRMRHELADRDAVRREHVEAAERAAAAGQAAERAAAKLAAAQESLAVLRGWEARCETVCGGAHAGPSFWESSHEAIHAASPWLDAEFAAARDELFVAAVRLHRAFVDAAARPMKSNLGLIMDHLKGKRVPSGGDAHLGDLWDTFFLLVPLVSTTFASLDRLMEGMGEASISRLVVDEAGQALPQAAVGALWRSTRALVIGDPSQIEPVSKVPAGLVRAICASYGGVHSDLWAAPRASVQTLADAASPLMASVGAEADAREIGMPLLVHRRCQEPMFSISNEIAYAGLMVHAAGEEPSPIAEALAPWLPRSCWLDVASEDDKWSRAEGDAVLDLLRRLAAQGVRSPDLYMISPFREVADKLRRHLVRSGVLGDLGIPGSRQGDWAKARVGTVHTFQGKEAEAVFLVLGASAEARRGSRGWAGGTPNILNVAATRARKALYVIGRRGAWSSAGVFAAASGMLPVVPWPVPAPAAVPG